MAYMDVQPPAPNGRAVVLLHGKNFCAATWEDTITVLDRSGLIASSPPTRSASANRRKPAHYQYSFQQLAGNTHALLASLGITRVTVIGHSTGGMLGIRYALMFPDEVEQAGAGRSDRARGLEGEGRAVAKRRCAGTGRS